MIYAEREGRRRGTTGGKVRGVTLGLNGANGGEIRACFAGEGEWVAVGSTLMYCGGWVGGWVGSALMYVLIMSKEFQI